MFFTIGCQKENGIPTTIKYEGELMVAKPVRFYLANKVRSAEWHIDTTTLTTITPVYLFGKPGTYHISVIGERGSKTFAAETDVKIKAPFFSAIEGIRSYQWRSVTTWAGPDVINNGVDSFEIKMSGEDEVLFKNSKLPFISYDGNYIKYGWQRDHWAYSVEYDILNDIVAASVTSGGMGGSTTTTYTEVK